LGMAGAPQVTPATVTVQATDGKGNVLRDSEGRLVSATIPADAEVITATSEEDAKEKAKTHPLAWIVVTSKSVGKEILHSMSVSIDAIDFQRFESSIWWQRGMPSDTELIVPGGTIQFNLKAKSIPFLANVDNKFFAPIINHTSIDFGGYRYGIPDATSKAQATGSGFSPPSKFPTYEWTVKGYAHGGYITVQEDLPFNLLGVHVPFYMAVGLDENTNQSKMTLNTATCSPGEIKSNYKCPKIKPIVWFDEDGSVMGVKATVGFHLTKQVSAEVSVIPVGDAHWAQNPLAAPPSYHGDAYSFGLRGQFK
jgi:hypothetical protein